MKKYLLLLMIPLLSGTGFAMGRKAPEGVSLLLVPARPSLVQLGMDMATQQHALLMTYAPGTATDKLFLHIWNGSQWLRVPQTSFENGSFIKNPASRLLVVGDENDLTASLIEKGLVWSPEVLHLKSNNITELINQMGRLYGFNRNDWKWIAARYDLQLENLNQDRPQTSWYDENKASDLPADVKPWKKQKSDEQVQPPETSLRPVMPPSMEPEVSAPLEMEIIIEDEQPVKEEKPEDPEASSDDAPADFSLEVE